MTNQLIIPKIIFTNAPEVVTAFGIAKTYDSFLNIAKDFLLKKIFDYGFKRISSDATLLVTTDTSQILNFEFSILGTNAEQRGLKIIIDFFDPTEEFEKQVFKQSLADLANNRTFYLAFGTGSDLSNWSNFHTVSLLYAESFQDYDQPKTIRLNLVSTAGLHEISEDIFSKYSKGIKDINISTSLTVSAAIQPFSTTKSEEAQAQFEADKPKISEKIEKLKVRLDELIQRKTSYDIVIDKADRGIQNYQEKYDRALAKLNDEFIAGTGRAVPQSPRVTELGREASKIFEQKQTLENFKSDQITLQTQLNPKIDELTKQIRDLESISRPETVYEETNQFKLEEFVKLFRGYSGLDYVIKQVVQGFLKSVFVQQNNILFVYDDTLSNFEASGSAKFNKTTLERDELLTTEELGETQDVAGASPLRDYTESIEDKIKKYIPGIELMAQPIPFDTQVTPIYQQGAERANEYSKRIRASLKVGRQQGETDDKFKQKLQEVFNSFEQAFTTQYKSFEDPCELYRETDLRIVNLFLDFIEKKSPELISELNLVRNQPLILFGKKSIIRALLYGETYSITNSIFINNLAKDYVDNTIKRKLEKENYSLYGSKEETLTPLQSILERLNIKNNEYISTTENFLAKVLIFRHNVENGNILSITVDDYKVYNKYLSIPTDLNLFVSEKPTSVDTLISNQILVALTTESDTEDDLSRLNNFIDNLKKSKKFKNSLIVQEVAALVASAEKTQNNIFVSNEEIKTQFNLFVSDLFKKYKEGLSLDVTLDNTNRKPEDVLRGLLRSIEKESFRVSIKTLPFFFVSNLSFLTEPCLLISKRPKLSGYNQTSEFDSVITGGYVIVGLKHKITKDSATSEFTLQKINTLA